MLGHAILQLSLHCFQMNPKFKNIIKKVNVYQILGFKVKFQFLSTSGLLTSYTLLATGNNKLYLHKLHLFALQEAGIDFTAPAMATANRDLGISSSHLRLDSNPARQLQRWAIASSPSLPIQNSQKMRYTRYVDEQKSL